MRDSCLGRNSGSGVEVGGVRGARRLGFFSLLNLEMMSSSRRRYRLRNRPGAAATEAAAPHPCPPTLLYPPFCPPRLTGLNLLPPRPSPIGLNPYPYLLRQLAAMDWVHLFGPAFPVPPSPGVGTVLHLMSALLLSIGYPGVEAPPSSRGPRPPSRPEVPSSLVA